MKRIWMKNAKVGEAAKKAVTAMRAPVERPAREFTVETLVGGAKLFRLPPFEGEESSALKAARLKLLKERGQR